MTAALGVRTQATQHEHRVSLVTLWSRLAYAPVYVIGVPWLRTGVWGVSFAGLLQILSQIL
jgi:uncharacterized MAPEG superfamily protein